MIEHYVWRGNKYNADGIGEQKIAIIGFSHYLANDEPRDWDNYTVDTVKQAMNGGSIQFFDRIAGYFDSKDLQDFWHRVMFFNFFA